MLKWDNSCTVLRETELFQNVQIGFTSKCSRASDKTFRTLKHIKKQHNP